MDDDGVTLQEIDAGANACSVEWCPIAGLERYVACSTYALESSDPEGTADAAGAAGAAVEHGAGADGATAAADDAEGNGEVQASAGGGQTRTGSVVIHKLSRDQLAPSPSPPAEEDAPSAPVRLQEAARVTLDGGVLDAKWAPQPLTGSSGAAVLACATSSGRLVLYTLSKIGDGEEGDKEKAELRQLASSDAGDSLLLSLDWSGGGSDDAKVVMSQSDGSLAVWRPHPNGGDPVQEVGPWPAHTLRGGVPTEAWIAFFRKSSGHAGDEVGDSSFVVSGADDALMKGWDLRAGGGTSPAFVCKDHGAGVTAGQWHPTLRHIFVSGSYDESVRIWDARALRTPVSTIATGGGLWRLKWHPDAERGNLLLAACMHAGMRVVDTGLDANDPLVEGSLFGSIDGGGEPEGRTEIVSKYTRHASMAYGADWCRLPTLSRSKRAVIASCSFYDSLLCLWQTPPLWTQ